MLLQEISRKKLLLFGILLGIGVLLILYGNRLTEQSISTSHSVEGSVRVLWERELEEFLNRTEGISEARVMLTLQYRDDGVFSQGSAESKEDYTVCGVAVLCRHGDCPEVQKRITEMLSTLLQLPSHKIFISGI